MKKPEEPAFHQERGSIAMALFPEKNNPGVSDFFLERQEIGKVRIGRIAGTQRNAVLADPSGFSLGSRRRRLGMRRNAH
jgi:hypothetical protein